MEEIGPVDIAIVAFPGNKFTGDIAPALAELRRGGDDPDRRHRVRRKRQDGQTVKFELTSSIPRSRRASIA